MARYKALISTTNGLSYNVIQKLIGTVIYKKNEGYVIMGYRYLDNGAGHNKTVLVILKSTNSLHQTVHRTIKEINSRYSLVKG